LAGLPPSGSSRHGSEPLTAVGSAPGRHGSRNPEPTTTVVGRCPPICLEAPRQGLLGRRAAPAYAIATKGLNPT
jgi:hypothetical protein